MRAIRASVLAIFVVWTVCGQARAELSFVVLGPEDPSDALNDHTAATPVAGNDAKTLGQQRWLVIQHALLVWSRRLEGAVPVVVQVSMPPLPCGSLGGAQSNGYVTKGPNLRSDQVYPMALAEQLAGVDLNDGKPDILLELNGASCVEQGPQFYLGLKGPIPTGHVSLLHSVAHELAHGLGFESLVNPFDGRALRQQPGLDPFSRQLIDTESGRYWHELSAAERARSAKTPRSVVWGGAYGQAAARNRLELGNPRVQTEPKLGGFTGSVTAPSSTVRFELIEAPLRSLRPNDACEALAHADFAHVLLVSEGQCSPQMLAQIAREAGALAVLEVEAGEQLPPPSFAAREGALAKPAPVPVLRVGKTDGALLEKHLPLVRLSWDTANLSGADEHGRPYLYTPQQPILGASLSHWDPSLQPSALLEPAPAADSTALDLEMEHAVLLDLGWRNAGSDTPPYPGASHGPHLHLDDRVANAELDGGLPKRRDASTGGGWQALRSVTDEQTSKGSDLGGNGGTFACRLVSRRGQPNSGQGWLLLAVAITAYATRRRDLPGPEQRVLASRY